MMTKCKFLGEHKFTALERNCSISQVAACIFYLPEFWTALNPPARGFINKSLAKITGKHEK